MGFEKEKVIGALSPYIREKLYPYQKKWLGDKSRFRIVNKGRQLGFSWVTGLDVLIGALLLGKNQLVLSSSLDNAAIIGDYVREHIEATGIEVEQDKANRIKFFNGKSIRMLATNWRTARGFNGDITFDEFAFTLQDSLMWTALVPSVTAVGGRVSVISTPKSRIDKFWQLWEAKNSFSKHLLTIHDAKAQGFDVNIEELRELFTPEEFAQAYECIPLDTTDSFIPYTLIEPCIDLTLKAGYDGNYMREYEDVFGWESDGTRFFLHTGVDIGRTRDETAIVAINQERGDIVVRHISEMKKTAFWAQKEFLQRELSKQMTFKMGIDRGGIGMNLHETLQYAYPAKVIGYNHAPAVKERLAKNLKRMFEERKIKIPNHAGLISQILSIKRSPTKTNIFRYDTEDKTHHADKFWALAMAVDMVTRERVVGIAKLF